jgi:uncharacterized membrane protein YoaK (UPF0700 family)
MHDHVKKGHMTAGITRQTRTRNMLVACLALNSGATDAIGFIALGGAFTSVMTGNMVLLGLSLPRLDGTLAAHIGTAIVCYIAGASIGARVVGAASKSEVPWPAPITTALSLEASVIAVNALLWWITGSDPGNSMQLVMLALNAAALGIQGSSVQRFGVSGLSTTYLTGTLTTVVSHLMHGRPARGVSLSLGILVTFIIGAILGGVLVLHAAPFTPVIQLVSLGTVLVASIPLREASLSQHSA